MTFKLVILEPQDPGARTPAAKTWPDKIRELVPGVDIRYCATIEEAAEAIVDADAAFGDIVPELFERAQKLQWIQSPQAGPKAGYYHDGLVESDVVVTNMRGIFNDHISAHIMSYVLAFARGLHVYRDRQRNGEWTKGYDTVYLPEATAVIVGVGGIGGETARLCAEFGMTVIGVDARVTEPPPGVGELHGPDALDEVIPRADFLIVTVPETPSTQGLFNRSTLSGMKSERVLHQHRTRRDDEPSGPGGDARIGRHRGCGAGRVRGRAAAVRASTLEAAQRHLDAACRCRRALHRRPADGGLRGQLRPLQRRAPSAERRR